MTDTARIHKRLMDRLAEAPHADIMSSMSEILEEAVLSGCWAELADLAVACYPEEDLEEMFDLKPVAPAAPERHSVKSMMLVDVGGGLIGYLDYEMAALERVLGPAPRSKDGDAYKVKFEWCVRLWDGIETADITIYDYKAGRIGPSFRDWHVGGKAQEPGMKLLTQFLSQSLGTEMIMEKQPDTRWATIRVGSKSAPELLNCHKHGAVAEPCATCDCIHGAV